MGIFTRYLSDVLEITELSAYNKSISSLQGIQYLTDSNLSNNNIINVKKLVNLTNLFIVNLTSNTLNIAAKEIINQLNARGITVYYDPFPTDEVTVYIKVEAGLLLLEFKWTTLLIMVDLNLISMEIGA